MTFPRRALFSAPLCLWALGCAQSETTAAGSALSKVQTATTAKRTLRLAIASRPQPLDPALAVSAEQGLVARPAYQRLARRRTDPVTGGALYAPEAARVWEASPDRRAWTFKLAPGQRFEDGGPLDAAAVKFSFDRLIGLGRGPATRAIETIERVEALDAERVRFVLKNPNPRFLSVVSDRAASLVSPAVMAHAVNGDWGSAWLATRSAGSGPYALQPDSGGGVHVLSRNPHYGGSAPFFDRVVMREMPDPTLRAFAVLRGEIDVAFLMPSQSLRRVAGRSDVRVASMRTSAYQNLAFNLDRPAFQDVRLRQAVAAAIDTDAIRQHIRGGHASAFAGPLATGMIGADPALYPVRFEPARAAALARSIGSPPPRRVTMIYPGVSPETDTVAQYVQAVLAPLRLRVRLERLTIPAYLDRTARGAYDLVLMGFVAEDDDASAILNFWFDPARAGVQNPARYRDAETFALIQRAETELDETIRARLHREIATRVNQTLPYVFLQQTHLTFLVRDDIEGLDFDPLEGLDLPYARLRRSP